MQIRSIGKGVAKVRIEKREDKKQYIVGYASVYYKEGDKETEYELYSDLFERIMPGAFDRAVREDDVRALLNHDPNMLLARTGNDLKLSLDDVGLKYEFPIDERDADHLKTLTKIDRGDMDGSSFGFYPTKRTFIEYEDFDVVEINEVKLVDVSPVTFPAYTGTSVGTRNEDGIEETLNAHKEWKKGNLSMKKDQDDMARCIALQLKANAGIL